MQFKKKKKEAQSFTHTCTDVYLCARVIYPYDPPVWGAGVDYETHRELIPTGSGRVTLSSHLGFCSPLWNSRSEWTFIQSLSASVSRTSGRLKKASFCDLTQRRFNTLETLYREPSKWGKGKSSAQEWPFFFYPFPKQATNLPFQMLRCPTFNELVLGSHEYPQQFLLRNPVEKGLKMCYRPSRGASMCKYCVTLDGWVKSCL